MKVFIQFENDKKILNTVNYQSIESIINQYLLENNLSNLSTNQFFLDYNGKYLNNSYSLEKYNIYSDTVLNLNYKVKGGNSFFTFIFQHPIEVAIVFIIALTPIFLLPLGIIPLTSTLIKLIIENSVEKVGRFLVCTLGKKTLYNRLKLFLLFVKYLTFILMIFVIITFPLLMLCITLKGHSLFDNPKSMCSGITAGNTAGMVLTFVFLGFYLVFRTGNYFFDFFINLFKKVYTLDTLFNPTLLSIKNTYNKFKYIPIGFIPFIGAADLSYQTALSAIVPALKIFLSTISSVGCKDIMNKNEFTKALMNNIKKQANEKKNNEKEQNNNEKEQNNNNEKEQNNEKEENENEDNDKKNSDLFKTEIKMCKLEKNNCCSPSNFVKIGDIIVDILKNPLTSSVIKSSGLFPTFILFVEAFYESALTYIGDGANFELKNFDEQKFYLRKLLDDKINIMSENTKDIIKEFLEKGDENLISTIKNKLNKDFPTSENELVQEIKFKLKNVETMMIDFSIQNKSAYVQGKSLFKIIFRVIFLNIFCNTVNTSNTAQDIIYQAGDVEEMTDMLKAGNAAGLFTGMIYFITVIILIICGIFNIF